MHSLTKMSLTELFCDIFYMKSILPDVPTGIYLLKVNIKNAGTGCEICSKLTTNFTLV